MSARPFTPAEQAAYDDYLYDKKYNNEMLLRDLHNGQYLRDLLAAPSSTGSYDNDGVWIPDYGFDPLAG